jgi:molybdenum cofactor cytidylyltransferase
LIAAVVLAAGESRRMGRSKPLLQLGDRRTFIEAIVTALKRTSVGKIVVVVGANAEEITRAVSYLGVTTVANPDFKLGQLSSLWAAIRALEGEPIEGLLVHLADHPFLSPTVVDKMIAALRESGKLVVIPRYRGKRGHPVLLARDLFQEILAAPLDEGAKAVVRAHAQDTLEIDVEEEGVTIDIDTPEDYRRHVTDA